MEKIRPQRRVSRVQKRKGTLAELGKKDWDKATKKLKTKKAAKKKLKAMKKAVPNKLKKAHKSKQEKK